MKVITAPNSMDRAPYPRVFLAGGITNCPEWQDAVVAVLRARDIPGTLLNPRRKNFPIGDPKAATEQITWEFRALQSMAIFSMWFCAGPSAQPICMYELGRHVARFSFSPRLTHVVVGVEPGYLREADVRIQLELAKPGQRITTTLTDHVDAIREAVIQQAAKELR